MFWLLERKFETDGKVVELKQNLERFGIEYSWVSVFEGNLCNFDKKIDVDFLKTKRIFSYGSYNLSKIAVKNFEPGAFFGTENSMENLKINYGKELLNFDMVETTFTDFYPNKENYFVRPLNDGKEFIGKIFSKDEIIKAKDTDLNKIKICVSECKRIQAEYRCFMVDGKSSTASQYKRNGEPFFSAQVDEFVTEYADKIAKIWSPFPAFALDIAICNNKPYVLEINSINSAGLYKIDTQKLIIDVEKL